MRRKIASGERKGSAASKSRNGREETDDRLDRGRGSIDDPIEMEGMAEDAVHTASRFVGRYERAWPARFTRTCSL